MIVVRLMGGHSNQLFQYAVGRQLANRLGTELLLDTTWFDNVEADTQRFFELDVYPLKAETTKLENMRIIDPRQSVSFMAKLKRKLHMGNDIWMHYENGQGFNPDIATVQNNTLLIGYWQCEKYFTDIRDEILEETEPIAPLSRTNKLIVDKMAETESVWMHVRRGDYVTNKNYTKFHGLKGLDYYQKALDTLVKKLPKDRVKNLHIFVCSNDIPWCKKNLKFPYPITFIENELGSDDMRVAKHCKHDIIANSSFSWWGAWLNQNPDKIVIAPKRWFEDETANDEIDIVLDSWIRI